MNDLFATEGFKKILTTPYPALRPSSIQLSTESSQAGQVFPWIRGLIGLVFDDIEIVKMDTNAGKRAEDLAKKVIVAREFTFILDLGLGQEEARILTSDLSTDYVRISADCRT